MLWRRCFLLIFGMSLPGVYHSPYTRTLVWFGLLCPWQKLPFVAVSLQLKSVSFLETGIETFKETGHTTINKTEKCPSPPGMYVLGQRQINKPLWQTVGSTII